jgi:hypothetical protein
MMNNWDVEEFSRNLDGDSVRFTTPEGFEFVVYTPLGCIELLMALSLSDTELSFGGSRFWVHKGGSMTLIDTDPWLNSGFEYGAEITKSHVLAFMIGSYLLGKLRK